MSDYYILENKKIKSVEHMEWCKWFENNEDRIIKHDTIGDILVSTVFLGIDHNWAKKGEPILFETMIFDDSGYQERYTSYDEALKGHEEAKQKVLNK